MYAIDSMWTSAFNSVTGMAGNLMPAWSIKYLFISIRRELVTFCCCCCQEKGTIFCEKIFVSHCVFYCLKILYAQSIQNFSLQFDKS